MALIACTWMAVMSVVLMFPSTPTLEGEDGEKSVESMNFTVVVQGGVMVLSLVYYWFPWGLGGVYWFKGPVPTVEKAEKVVGEGEGSVGEESEKGSQKGRVVVDQQDV